MCAISARGYNCVRPVSSSQRIVRVAVSACDDKPRDGAAFLRHAMRLRSVAPGGASHQPGIVAQIAADDDLIRAITWPGCAKERRCPRSRFSPRQRSSRRPAVHDARPQPPPTPGDSPAVGTGVDERAVTRLDSQALRVRTTIPPRHYDDDESILVHHVRQQIDPAPAGARHPATSRQTCRRGRFTSSLLHGRAVFCHRACAAAAGRRCA